MLNGAYCLHLQGFNAKMDYAVGIHRQSLARW